MNEHKWKGTSQMPLSKIQSSHRQRTRQYLLRDGIGNGVDVARDDLLRHRLRAVADCLRRWEDDLCGKPLRQGLDLRTADGVGPASVQSIGCHGR